MVTSPKGPKDWVTADPAALREADIDAWMYPASGGFPSRGLGFFERAFRAEFLHWAKHRPARLRKIRSGTDLFRLFMEEFSETPTGQLRMLEISKREYERAYEADTKFPGWSKEKSLQMLRRIGREIEELKAQI